MIAESTYFDVCRRGHAGVCGVRKMLFTGGLFVGITGESYVGRYCYETIEQARAALIAWKGIGDPPGAWIKYKSSTEERLGPGADC